jgi:glycosyltransferase 2 family protein
MRVNQPLRNTALLGLAWYYILGHLGLRPGATWSIRVFGITQLGKYIPGNIFHLAGRQALGVARGFDGWRVLRSQVWEQGLLATCGLMFILLAPTGLWPVDRPQGMFWFFPTVLTGLWLLHKKGYVCLAKAYLLHLTFLFWSGFIFWALLQHLGASLTSRDGLMIAHSVIGAYVVSWLVGLITPGAPAGAGIREFALYYFLSSCVGESTVMTSVLLSRLITIVGDIFFYLAALLIKPGGPAMRLYSQPRD